MRIARLTGTNIKGKTFDHELNPVTVFSGPNYSGKTARIDALKLALLGFHPELMKSTSSSARGMWKLSSGKSMKAMAYVETETEGTNCCRDYAHSRQNGRIAIAPEGYGAPKSETTKTYCFMLSPDRAISRCRQKSG